LPTGFFLLERSACPETIYLYTQKFMAKKLFVGGLPYSTTENELTDLFAQAGAVDSAVIIKDKMTGESKGFGFIEMNDEDAEKAISTLDGTDFGGRKLTVNEARPREERRPGGDRRY